MSVLMTMVVIMMVTVAATAIMCMVMAVIVMSMIMMLMIMVAVFVMVMTVMPMIMMAVMTAAASSILHQTREKQLNCLCGIAGTSSYYINTFIFQLIDSAVANTSGQQHCNTVIEKY